MLQKQTVSFPLSKGINKYTPDQLTSPDEMAEGTNNEILRSGEIVKRAGFAPHVTLNETGPLSLLPNNGTPGVASQNGLTEVGYFVGTSSPVDFQNKSGGIVKPSLGDLSAKLFNLVGFSQSVPSYDIYTDEDTGDITFAFVSSNTSARVYKFDKELNNIPFAFGVFDEFTGFNVSLNNFVALKCLPDKVVFWSTTTGQINLVTLDSSGVASNNAIQAANASDWDVCRGNTGEFILAYSSGGTITVSRRSLSTGASLGSVTTSNTNVSRVTLFSRVQPSTSNRDVFLGLLRTTGNKIEVQTYNSSLVLQTTASNSGGASTYYAISGAASATPSTYYVAVESGDATVGNTFARNVSFYFPASSTVLQQQGETVFRAGLYSKGLQIAVGQRPSFLLQYRSEDTYNLQNSYFLMTVGDNGGVDGNADLKGVLEYGRADGYHSFVNDALTLGAPMPNICHLTETTAIAGLQLRSKSATLKDDLDSIYNVGALVINQESAYHGSKPIEVGGKVYLACGNIYSYSGTGLKAINFLNYPDPIASFSDLGAGSVAAGTYQYCLVYEYRDDAGDVIESAPSQITSVTHAHTRQYDIVHRVPGWIAGMATWSVVAYRTAASGTIFYRCAEVQYTEGVSSPLSLVDNLSDAVLTAGPILYTTGGVVENTPPPYTNWVSQARNRLWTFKHGDTSQVWFTKTITSGFIPQFSDLLTLNVDIQYGELKGVSALDDKVIIFKEKAVYVVVGEGPTENLVGSFSPASSILTGKGCISSRSILETPSGVFFQSQEGIHLIDKGLGVQFIGQPLYKSEGTILTSVYDPADNKALFLAEGVIWVFYLTSGVWQKWTAPNALDIAIIDGDLFMLTTTKVLKQVASVWQDDGANYAQEMKIGQFQLAGLQGYQRVYRFLLSGRQVGSASGTITAKTFVDGSATATDTLTLAQSDTVTGNTAKLEIRPSVQRCESLQFSISHEANNPGLTLSSVAAEVGLLTGAGRRAGSKRLT